MFFCLVWLCGLRMCVLLAWRVLVLCGLGVAWGFVMIVECSRDGYIAWLGGATLCFLQCMASRGVWGCLGLEVRHSESMLTTSYGSVRVKHVDFGGITLYLSCSFFDLPRSAFAHNGLTPSGKSVFHMDSIWKIQFSYGVHPENPDIFLFVQSLSRSGGEAYMGRTCPDYEDNIPISCHVFLSTPLTDVQSYWLRGQNYIF
ncbi:hypothetical protein BDQ17DRAFT_1414835 [Cyathus striatus]|nr:hypothetical protein BDQ17DRAFT_1414835 [Cyathus striatus]